MQDHGAIGDGTAYDTAAIQAAINACTNNKDGGVVIFDEEKQYLTGQVILKDGVRLRLPESATILAGSKVRGSHRHFCFSTPGTLDLLDARWPPCSREHLLIGNSSLESSAPVTETAKCGLQRENYPKSYGDWYLILLECQNCGIDGEGRIDAQGTLWTYGGCASIHVLMMGMTAWACQGHYHYSLTAQRSLSVLW